MTSLIVSNKTMRILSKLNVIASESNMNIKHAAGLIKGGKLIDYGTNSNRSNYSINGKKFLQCSLHAEIGVIRRLIYNLKKNNKLNIRKMSKYTLIVIRKNFSNSLPCKHCSRVIKQSGISKIYYTNGEPEKCILTKTNTKNLKSNHQSRAVTISKKYLS
mgnify:CR=1 FL=1